MSEAQLLLIPALRAHMGDWLYYVGSMRFKDVAERISMTTEIHSSSKMGEWIQRTINRSRSTSEIATYLVDNEQRLFSSLIVGVYGGDPVWTPVSIRSSDVYDLPELPTTDQATMGVLKLEGTEKLFAIDGQHRVFAIKHAVALRAQLGDERVGVIFVGHNNEPDGLERTRRLFATLNRYAKPVNKLEAIALDEDDVVAVVTRRLIDTDPLFKDKTAIRGTKSLHPNDTTNVTTVVALYDSLDLYLRDDNLNNWRMFKRHRPDDQTVAKFEGRARELFAHLRTAFPELERVAVASSGSGLVEKGRGHLLFRPRGLELVVRTVRHLMDGGVQLGEAVRRIGMVPMRLSEPPWKGLLWDPQTHRMLVRGANPRVALYVMLYGAGGDLGQLKRSTDDVRRELASALNRVVTDVSLEQYAAS